MAATATGRHEAFKAAVESWDVEALTAALHPDVVFNSPAVHSPYEGRDACLMILAAVAQVFEGFHYTDILDAGDSVGLVFAATVGDRQLQGWDYLRFDEDGRIVEFTVMVRPLSGLNAVVARMGELLQAGQQG